MTIYDVLIWGGLWFVGWLLIACSLIGRMK
jgi:hypothetical protein